MRKVGSPTLPIWALASNTAQSAVRSALLRFIVRRSLGVLLSVWVAVTLVFGAMQIVPGDPAEAALSQSTASYDVLERRRAEMGLDQPLVKQYARYLLNLASGHLGVSWSGGQPVELLIRQELPPTVELAVCAMLVAIGTGLLLGLAGGMGQGHWIGGMCRSLVAFLLSFPVMFSGTLAIWLFAVTLGWLPATGQGTAVHVILPACVVGLSVSGGIARTIDASVSDALHEPFMLLAYAKGLTRLRAVWRHALRVGLLPILNVIAVQTGFLLGGTVVTESVFARQGIGRLLLVAVLDKDLPIVQGVVALSAVVYGLLNLLADVAHAVLDPRVRHHVT